MRLEIFDVEHGGCALLTCDNGARMMIDCGHNSTTGWYPGDYLRSIGVRYLDMLVVTNYDQDHISGYPNLANNVEIGGMVRNMSVAPRTIYELKSDVGTVSAAMARYVRDISMNFGGGDGLQNLAPPVFPNVAWNTACTQYPAFDDENNLSLLLHLKIHETGFLFTGDLEKAGWKHLLATNPFARQMVQDTVVYMASHHGRESGRCPEIFDEYGCRPQLVVVSDDYMQHMSQETTAYYRSKTKGMEGFRVPGMRHVLTTRRDGNLVFHWDIGSVNGFVY